MSFILGPGSFCSEKALNVRTAQTRGRPGASIGLPSAVALACTHSGWRPRRRTPSVGSRASSPKVAARDLPSRRCQFFEVIPCSLHAFDTCPAPHCSFLASGASLEHCDHVAVKLGQGDLLVRGDRRPGFPVTRRVCSRAALPCGESIRPAPFARTAGLVH